MRYPVLSEKFFGLVVRVQTGCDLALKREAGFNPKFGFLWFYWLPRVQVHRQAGGAMYVNVTWLCWMAYFVTTMRELIPTIVLGSIIPWGLSWYEHQSIKDAYGNRITNERRQLVLQFPLPLVYRRKPQFIGYQMRDELEVFGFACCRIRFWSDFDFFWLEDKSFCKDMIDQPPVTGHTYYEIEMDRILTASVQRMADVIDAHILEVLRRRAQC